MNPFVAKFRKFVSDAGGAVTVDYVVLTAAAAAVALASTDVVLGGLSALAGNVTTELTGEQTDSGGQGLQYADGFDNGADGWIGAEANEIAGIGHVLGPITGSGGQVSVSKQFQLNAGIAEATMSFDVLAMDSIDTGEYGHLFMNGVEIGKIASDGTFQAIGDHAALGLTVGYEIKEQNVQLGGNLGSEAWWKDSKTSFNIKMANPDEYVTFGFGSSTNQNADDESFAIDNFKMNGLKDPNAQTGGSPTG
ncbi:MAG: hypothetical protein WBA51_14080 [Erythrobacter sp.]